MGLQLSPGDREEGCPVRPNPSAAGVPGRWSRRRRRGRPGLARLGVAGHLVLAASGVTKMHPEGRFSIIEARRPRWQSWIERFDPVGPIVSMHVLALVVFGDVLRPVGVLVVAGALWAWRASLNVHAGRVKSGLRGHVCMFRGAGSLGLAGALVALDGGTESPLFFSMLIVVVWETVTGPVRRLIGLTMAATVSYLGVIALADDVTGTSVVRLGVFLAFIGLLLWSRALSEHWQEESVRALTLAARIAEEASIGFALYDCESLSCLFANETARRFGLTEPDLSSVTEATPSDGPPQNLREVLRRVGASGDPGSPSLYVTRSANGRQTFLRIGMSHDRIASEPPMLMVYAEDVTSQVVAGEQHRRFLESANHQFRTPLSPVIAYSELIAKGDLEDEELREAAEAIREGGARIERLLNRISSMLRLQRAPEWPETMVTVRELIDEHVIPARPGLSSVLVIEGELDSTVRCEPELLAVALSELIDNGLKHGTPPVTLSAERVGEGVRLRLWDLGPGPDIDSETPLDRTWSLLVRPDVMPPEAGDRLGISYACTVAAAAGGALRFERDGERWAFACDLHAVRSPSRAGIRSSE